MVNSFGALLPFSFCKTVLEMCVCLAGDWLVGLFATMLVLRVGICLVGVPGRTGRLGQMKGVTSLVFSSRLPPRLPNPVDGDEGSVRLPQEKMLRLT